jgi:hypothetical protein
MADVFYREDTPNFPIPATLPLQALVQDELTNLCVLEINRYTVTGMKGRKINEHSKVENQSKRG